MLFSKKVCKYKFNNLISLNSNQAKVIDNFKIVIFISVLTITNIFSQEKKYVFSEQKMGSAFGLQFYHIDSLTANKLAKKAFLLVDSLNISFSDYMENSEINKVSKNAGNGLKINISEPLLQLLIECKRAYFLSNGAFDITIGHLTKLWRKARKSQEITPKDELNKAIKNTGMRFLEIDTSRATARLLKNNVSIDLGGIAKGFAAQKVLEFLQNNGVKSALIDAAGNMAIGSRPPNYTSWKVAIEIPRNNYEKYYKLLNISNMGVSTSGDTFQFIQFNGKKYSHILNPKTGLGMQNGRQVTVICENAVMADWLSTTLCILPIKKALNLTKKVNFEAFIVQNKRGIAKIKTTKNFQKYIHE